MTAPAFFRWLGFAIAALVAGLFVAAPASAQNSSQVTCESWQFRPARCNVPGIIDASIARAITRDCKPGNWGFDREGIFVINGCRAIFNVTTRGGGFPGGPGGGFPGGGFPGGGVGPGFPGGPGGGGQIVRCESMQFQPARCPMDTRGGVRIQRVLADHCRQNQTWGWDRQAVWVNGGCRADFVSGNGGNGGGNGGGWGGGGGPGGQIIECNSINFRPARCPAVIRSGVQLDRVLGGECVQNRSWGFDGGAVWVNNGCRARFRVF